MFHQVKLNKNKNSFGDIQTHTQSKNESLCTEFLTIGVISCCFTSHIINRVIKSAPDQTPSKQLLKNIEQKQR